MYESKFKRLQNELIFGVIALGGVFLLGTLWYWCLEHWSFVDAAYMTMITLSTVGFSEVHPLNQRSEVFTIGLILLGLVSIGYIANRFTEALIQGYFQEGLRQRQKQRLIDTLSEHYILCGLGRTGYHIALEFQAEGIPFVVIDSQEEQIKTSQELGYPFVEGDATLDEVLLKAGVTRAICLVTALPSDAENLYTVLSAKSLNPDIRAISRASSEEAVQKLRRAGADDVVSPYTTGGRRLAAAALRPQIMDFVDGIITGTDRSFYLEELRLDPKICPCVGQTLQEARLRLQSGALILAIRRLDGTLIGGPTGDDYLQAGDLLFCMGTAEQLRKLNNILDPISFKNFRKPKR